MKRVQKIEPALAWVGVLLFAVIVLFTQPQILGAASIDTLQQDIKEKRSDYQELQDKASVYKENLKAKQQEITTLDNELERLDENISLTETEIEQTETEIELIGLEIDQIAIQIDETQGDIDKSKSNISALISDLYGYQQKTFLEVALTNATLSEFSNQIEYTEEVNSQFKETLDDLTSLKKDLKDTKLELSDKQQQEETKREELGVRKGQLETEVGFKNTLLLDVEEDEEKFQALLEEVKAEQAAINSEITQLEKSARKKLDELNATKTPETPDSDADTGQTTSPIALPTEFNPDWPLRGIVTATFRDPTYPYRSYFEHAAIDIAAPQGTSIRAAEGGVVSVVRYDGTTNYAFITIVHANNFQTLYGHVNQVFVQPEQVVEKGEIIALSGASPGTIGAGRFTTGPHLHFEVWLSGVKVDPMLYLP